MAKDPERDKPIARRPLTGTAQPVTNSVERARRFLKDRPEPHAAPSKRKSFRPKRPELEEAPQATTPDPNMPDSDGDPESEDEPDPPRNPRRSYGADGREIPPHGLREHARARVIQPG